MTMENERKCPICTEPLDCDEVDIGVGIMLGNWRCPTCGWDENSDHVMPTLDIDVLGE